MTLLTKGYNIIKKLSGSSYLLEIDKLTEEYDNLIIFLNKNSDQKRKNRFYN